MLSALQIYRDSKENGLVSSTKDRKLSSTDKPKCLGLKISTNINHEKKSSSGSTEKSIKQFDSNKNVKQQQALSQNSKSEDQEEWPEVENMFICDVEDDYEDIIPKHERFTQEEIDVFFRPGYIGRINEEADDAPILTLNLSDLTDFISPPPMHEEELYLDIELENIPELSPCKYWD